MMGLEKLEDLERIRHDTNMATTTTISLVLKDPKTCYWEEHLDGSQSDYSFPSAMNYTMKGYVE